MTYQDFFKNKKITVMGLGLLGRGIGDIRFLAEQGAQLIVTDLKTEADLAPALAELADLPGIAYHLGGHDFADFEGCDLILKASGVPLDSPYIAHARQKGVPIGMSVALFAKFFTGPIIGVTGSLGKTTTAHLIDHVLKTAGIASALGGNVRGVSTLTMLTELSADTVAVLELDSWSLQGFGEEKISPAVAVFTAFVPDHMNYYHGDMDAYFADKANIYLNQGPEDTFVCAESVVPLVKQKHARAVRSKLAVAKPSDIPKSWKLLLPGEHTRSNAACALHAARALGIDDEIIKEAVESFAGVEGRLQFVREFDGIRYYNDTAATGPLPAAAGLAALDEGGKRLVVAIIGGADKTLDLTPFADALREHVKAIVALPGEGTDKLMPFLEAGLVTHAADLKDAVSKARALAKPGDVVTLSPGFASFGQFKNMYDRGDQFRTLVEALQ